MALKEHCTFPDIAARIGPDAIRARGLTPGGLPVPAVNRREQLKDLVLPLRSRGVAHLDMPMSAQRVWQALQGVEARAA